MTAPHSDRFADQVEALAARLSAWRSARPPWLAPVVVYGSSTVRLWREPAADLRRDDVVAVGFGGARLDDLAAQLDRLVAPVQPATLVIACGANDLDVPGTTPEQLAERMAQLLERVRALEPRPLTLVLTVKPSPVLDARIDTILAANRALEALLAQRGDATLVDTCTPFLLEDGRADPGCYIEDRRHMNAAGYARWSSLLAAALPPAAQRWPGATPAFVTNER